MVALLEDQTAGVSSESLFECFFSMIPNDLLNDISTFEKTLIYRQSWVLGYLVAKQPITGQGQPNSLFQSGPIGLTHYLIRLITYHFIELYLKRFGYYLNDQSNLDDSNIFLYQFNLNNQDKKLLYLAFDKFF